MTQLKLNLLEKTNDEIILGEIVKGMKPIQREKVLDLYATCLDCSAKFFEENGRKPKKSCQFCVYNDYKLI